VDTTNAVDSNLEQIGHDRRRSHRKARWHARRATGTIRRRTRSVIAAVVTLGVCVTLAACQAAPAPQKTDSGKGTINWWGYGPDISVVNQYLAAFNKQYPDIKVNFKLISQASYQAVLRPALASNSGPDIFLESPGALGFSKFSSYGIDLSDDFQKALGPDWKSKVAPSGLSDFTKDGKLLAAPVGQDVAGLLWINKDLFDKYKLTPPTTFDQWVQVCAQFKSHGTGCFVQGAQMEPFNQDTYQSIANSLSPGLYDRAVKGDAKWSDPGLVKALQEWKSLFSNGIMQPGALGVAQYPDADSAFMSGKYAMVQMGTWYMSNTRADVAASTMKAAGYTGKPFTILPIPFPTPAGGSAGALFGDSGGGLAINVKSSNQAAATTFVTWLATSSAGQQTIANLLTNTPSLIGAKPDFGSISLVNPSVQQPALEQLLAQSQKVTEPRQLANSDLATALGTELSTVALGSASPADAAATMETAAEGLR
jgi:raffinose/stachyose/melibiose transport system substrate-binding protein